jgi:hypothetical protein
LYLYPLDLRTEIPNAPTFKDLKNEQQFEAALREFFAHADVRRVVAALKAQAVAAATPAAQP